MQIALPLLLSIVAGVLNMTVAGSLRIMGCAPDILLGVVMAASIHYGSLTGAFCGLLGGLVLDSILGPYLGVSAFLYMFSGFLIGRLYRPNMSALEKLMASSAWAAGTYLIKQLVGLLTVYFSAGQLSLPMVLFTVILPGMLYSTLFAVALSLLLGLLFSRPSLQPRWRRDIFHLSSF